MWSSENERLGIKNASPRSYTFRNLAEIFYLLGLLTAIVLPIILLIQNNSHKSLFDFLLAPIIGLLFGALLMCFSSIFFLCGEYYLSRACVKYDYEADKMVPSAGPLRLSAVQIIFHILNVTLFRIPELTVTSWQGSRFNTLHVLRGGSDKIAVEIKLWKNGDCVLLRVSGKAKLSIVCEWEANKDLSEIKIKLVGNQTITMNRQGLDYKVSHTGVSELDPRYVGGTTVRLIQ